MGLMVAGAILGILFGWGFLGYHGWGLGALVGGLAGLVLQQIQKIGLLEKSIQALKDDQVKTSQQLALLKNELLDKFATKDAPIVKKPLAEVVNEAIASEPVAVAKTDTQSSKVTESLELDLDLPEAVPQPKIIRAVIQPAIPREPDVGDKIFAAVRRFFTEGNPIVNIGMVIMFFGVSFLVKYASSQGLFPIELRLTGVILGAIALLVFGWKTRERVGGYGLVLQGGGIAVIYLTLFAAAKIYGLIPLGIAFGLLFVVVILGVLLALLQNTQLLAILATAGGFLAPILTSTGDGSHVGLFSFYLILNFGILAIALKKAWRLLNWVGFMFTFVITAAWGVLKYQPVFYETTQPFLIAFFVLYLAVSILFSFKQPTNLKGMVDGSLVFGLPLIAFGLQTALLKHTEYGLAISAIVLAAVYIALSLIMSRRYLQTHRVLIESFLALGVSFATLAVPLALDASWTSVTWALEATGLVWVGLRQERLRPRVVGYLLHCAAVFSLIIFEGIDTGLTPVISGDFLGLALLALTSFIIAYLSYSFGDRLGSAEKIIAPVGIALGVLWWFVAGINEMNVHVMDQHLFAAIMLFATLSAVSLILIGKKLSWDTIIKSVYSLLPFMLLLFIIVFFVNENDTHPSHGFSLIAIALFFVVQYGFLLDREKIMQTSASILLRTWHVLTAWGIFGLIFWEVSWQKAQFNLQGTAGLMIWFAALMIPVIVLIGAGQKKIWPFTSYQQEFKNWIPAPLFALSAIWFFAVCHKNQPNTEHYLPVLNPLDLAQFGIVLVFAYAAKRHFLDAVSFISNAVRAGLLGIMLFVWLNVATLRAISHYQSIPYYFDSLWNAVEVQMALSILWTVCALVIMNISRKIQRRELWMIGAGLLGLVIIKLIAKDLSGKDTLAGIISFLVVGALILLIGYLSPIPAKIKSPDTEENINGRDKEATINE
ncbi:membrane protein [Cellvibrio zantedeschiae]|uniref:Membrane protein n=1 Tax=Cellvibrio zantedeschiae TaxID=1237077 RepID=A0ABQ3AXE4_9GAMM|nr:DUF2339 domain-containing protein [Cellvibrio zantedeschiae]GGY70831.1 membrane protein [Cellvibrio zantedeschiae]